MKENNHGMLEVHLALRNLAWWMKTSIFTKDINASIFLRYKKVF